MSKCNLRQNKKNEVFCMSCGKVYGKVQEIDTINLLTSCSMPSLFQSSKNFLISTAKHIANNATSTSKKNQKLRLSICRSCDFFQKDSQRCLKCGCYVNIKTSWASESCPEGKWDVEKTCKKKKTSGGCGCGKKKT